MTATTERPALGPAIAAARRAAGLSQRALADAVGVGLRTLGTYENDKSAPDTDTLRAIARACGVAADALLRGDVSGDKGGGESAPLVSNPGMGDTSSNVHIVDEATLVRIDHVNVEVSAGDGAHVDIEEVTGSTFHPAWYVRERFGVEPDRVKTVRVHGTSMVPTLMPGQEVEVVLMRPGERPLHGGVYVLRGPHGLLVKRLFFDDADDGRFVRIHSDNPEAGTDRVPLDVFSQDYEPLAHLRSGRTYY